MKLFQKRLLWIFLAAALAAGMYAGLRFSRLVDVPFVFERGDQPDLQTPPGFAIEIFADGLDGPRFMAFGPDGNLYVAERWGGRVTVLRDLDGDGIADERSVFADSLPGVHSIVFHQGAFYAGIPSGVVRLQDGDGDLQPETRQVVVDGVPTSGTHNTRTVIFLPDGRMALSVGSSCNVCEEDDLRRAAVLVYDGPQGGGERVFASGLRNAVGLALHPESGALWATNNGRDLMGDDLPPDTVEVVVEGGEYGWPSCHSGRILDPNMGFAGACDGVQAPAAELQAHVAPLGLAFYDREAFPEAYRGDLFIAFHGSWNRSEPVGYKIVRLPLEGSRVTGPVEDFVWGWLEASGAVTGRPVGVTVGPDGALYVSDDLNGRIFRIGFEGG